ncbi:MAG: hypothetical protein M0D57_12000 [Sphingobacteriales bacterium JAD_PAG50586_3]|nr:MAG: hypothetical protein M0D57_12000 [Sphingobacteriales bacterium JAD_PAG50586_3]
MEKSFGIIITTYSGDYFFTKALLASIYKYMPAMPICLIQDGDFDISKELKLYNITHVLKREDIKDKFLRENCFGSRCTSLISFFESPFDRFLFLDSDIVLWGDISKILLQSDADFVHNIPHEAYSPYIWKHQYFDYERIFDKVDTFDWKDCHFFNSGVFISNRGIFDINLVQKLVSLWKEDKSLFLTAPQGQINYLAFYYKSIGKITVEELPLQAVVPVLSVNDLESKFKFLNNKPVVNYSTFIHWAGEKPLIMNNSSRYKLPMIYFRKEQLKQIKSVWRFWPLPYLIFDEFMAVINIYYKGSVWAYFKSKITRKFK